MKIEKTVFKLHVYIYQQQDIGAAEDQTKWVYNKHVHTCEYQL